MEEIEELYNKINKCENITEKIKMISLLDELIKNEKIKLTNLLENNLTNKVKIPLKYKKMSIEELEEAFNNTNNIYDKIIIYNAINKAYNNIFDELFDDS